MNDIQDLLHHAVRDVETDPDRLSVEARRRGLAIRRRRQALGLAGVAAATALVLGGAQLVTATTTPTSPGDGGPAASSPGATTRAPELVPANGQMTAAALQSALGDVSSGAAGQAAGGVSDDGSVYARLDVVPAGDDVPTTLEVRVQPDGDTAGGSCVTEVVTSTCDGEERADGYRFSAYETTRASAGGDVEQRVVDLVRPDSTRVTVVSGNGVYLPEGGWQVTRATPPLNQTQLRTIAENPAFGVRMDASWADLGLRPLDYVDVSGAGTEGWETFFLEPLDGRSGRSGRSGDWIDVEPPLPAPTTERETIRSLQQLSRDIRRRAAELRAEKSAQEQAQQSAEPDPED